MCAVDSSSTTVLSAPIQCGHAKVVKVLLEAGADPDKPNFHGFGPSAAEVSVLRCIVGLGGGVLLVAHPPLVSCNAEGALGIGCRGGCVARCGHVCHF